MLNIGDLRHQVTVEAPIEVDMADTFGEPSRSWVARSARWAAVETTGGREFFRAQQVQSNLTHLVRMRYDSDDIPTTSDRIDFDGRKLNIERVDNVDGRNIETRCYCVETTGGA